MNRPEVFSIPAHAAFADALAAGLLARFGGDPVALARVQLLLPNRRAVRSVTEAFVRAAGDGGVLLPRMTPVGDIGDDSFERLAAGAEPVAPAVSSLRRRLELARLAWARSGGSAVEALRLGDALGETLDALLEEEVSPDRIGELAADMDGQLAAHWAKTLAYLDVIVRAWPPERAALGATEGRTRLAALVDALIARWRDAPPGPVVAAGIVSATPAIGRLLAAVARLPDGVVVLPGLDTAMAETDWHAIHCRLAEVPDPDRPVRRDNEEHPQFALKLLLARLGVARGEVREWQAEAGAAGPGERTAAVAAAMAPARSLAGWQARDADALTAAFAGVTTIETASPAEEAQAIALALRRALETPGRTAALVTPERNLARRVAAHCKRFGIDIDDSAGQPLALTPPGALSLALVAAAAEGFAPAALLAVLKHPLVQRGEGRAQWLVPVRRLDLLLRGVRPPPGLDPVAERIDASDLPGKAALADWWAGAAAMLAPVEAALGGRSVSLDALAAALRESLSALAGDGLWSGPDGRALARLVEQVETEGAVLGAVAAEDAPGLWQALMAGETVRPVWGKHPRLAILGPLEARLQRADLMILGGLNEGVWPQAPSPDPWLPPMLRTALGLPGRERSIGLAAHDFVQALGAPRVIVSRARRDASAPTVASRLWLRLTAFAGDAIADDKELIRIARCLDSCDVPVPAARPMPVPPAAARPRRISVTQVDTLASDAFAFYANKILRLRVLDPLDHDPTPAERGTLIHDVLEQWVAAGHRDLAHLEQLGEAMLAREAADLPLLRALWGPRVRRLLEWAGSEVLAREVAEDPWTPLVAEARGALLLANGVEVTGLADRIDADAAGRLAIVDYKTGSPPSKVRMQAGFASQLALLAAMAEAGTFVAGPKRLPPGEVAELSFWKLGGGSEPGKATRPFKTVAEVADHVAAMLERVEDLTSALLLGNAPFQPKRRPGYAWSDYDRLARVGEWLGRGKPL